MKLKKVTPKIIMQDWVLTQSMKWLADPGDTSTIHLDTSEEFLTTRLSFVGT
jgi:hypothetical protein